MDNTVPPIISFRELLSATGVPPQRIEFLVRIGVLVPAKAAQGRGSTRVYAIENILEVQQAEELAKAGLSGHQLRQVFAEQRAQIATLSPSARVVARHRSYINTIVRLSEIFGRGPGYATWLKTQQRQLRKLERALTRAGEDAAANLDHRLLDIYLSAKIPENEAPALVG
jgi:DNA-binding transcriptional MerR regulator